MRGKLLTTLYDVAVIGSGFAGSLMAMIARRLGRSVVLIEKGTHPRVVIGESSTPLANLLLEDLAARYDLPQLRPFAKYGTWQQAYPDVACGLKRGFTFYHHDLSALSLQEPDREHQLLVAASPNDRIADTHWYRADLDLAFVEEAQRLGVEFVDSVTLHSAAESASQIRMEGSRKGKSVSFEARFVIDATGPRGFLHRAFNLREAGLPAFSHTQALYSHFKHVQRLEPQQAGENPPYPVNDAAVHHVFDGGWIWVLQFNNGMTSAGVALTDGAATRWNLVEGAPAWDRLLKTIPMLQRQFSRAEAAMPFTHLPRLSFRSATMSGNRWALLPSAAGFVDPLLSTGFPLTLLGITRLAEIMASDWDSTRFPESLQAYGVQTDGELLAAAGLIASLYANLHSFPVFVAIALIYFATASYSETVRRLGKHHLARSFLLYDHPTFGPCLTQLLARARQANTAVQAAQLQRDILRAIEPYNVAGLGHADRRNWYPVDPEDLFRAAGKVGASHEAIAELLVRSGF